MSLRAATSEIQAACSELECFVVESSAALQTLLSNVPHVQCSAEQFERQALELSVEEAEKLIVATIHRSMAYSIERMPLAEARTAASEFVGLAGTKVKYFSNCSVPDEVSGIGGWLFMVTSHTFESILYCVGEHESALLIEVDED
jgi:hypothetical protein